MSIFLHVEGQGSPKNGKPQCAGVFHSFRVIDQNISNTHAGS